MTNDKEKIDCGSTPKSQKELKYDLVRYVNKLIAVLKRQKRHGTAENYQSAINSFMRYREHQATDLRKIDSKMMEKYQSWLLSNGIRSNSASFYMRVLRTIYRKAVESKKLKDLHPFKRVYTGIAKTTKRAITIDELRRIKDLHPSKPSLSHAKDIFLMQFYAMGISFVDLAFLKKTNLKGDIIIYERQKTRHPLCIPAHPHLKEIIARHSDKESTYLVNLLNEGHIDPRRQYKTQLHNINRRLKIIGKMANIGIPLSTYVARHTWASIARDQGIPISIISEALGHDNIKTTQIYLSSLNREQLAKANNLIINRI